MSEGAHPVVRLGRGWVSLSLRRCRAPPQSMSGWTAPLREEDVGIQVQSALWRFFRPEDRQGRWQGFTPLGLPRWFSHAGVGIGEDRTAFVCTAYGSLETRPLSRALTETSLDGGHMSQGKFATTRVTLGSMLGGRGVSSTHSAHPLPQLPR
jgi:hypothetical protein